VNPNGLATTYQFEYGTTTSYGSVAPASPGSVGSGTAAVTESTALTGLAPDTTYDYEIVATSAGGTTEGGNMSFTTATSSPPPPPSAPAPTATTTAATGVGPTAATLSGTVNPDGLATTYQFEYGTSTSYGSVAPASPASAGSGTSAVQESVNLTGLSPATTYDFEIVATSASGTTDGGNETFTTSTSLAEGTYVPITPIRVTDTRVGSGLPNAGHALKPGGTLNVAVAGTTASDGVPAGALAIVANITAVTPSAAGYLTAYPTGSTRPASSNLNFKAGESDANLVELELGAGGDISIYNSAGTTNVLVDVYGYYTASPSSTGAGLYNPVSPYRAAGTEAVGARVAAGTSLPVTVTGGATGVPAGAEAVVVNLTAAHGSEASYLSAYAAGASRPTVSNLNFTPDEVVANRATVPVGTAGQIEVYNHAGTVDVDVDIDGYYTAAGGTGSVFVPITPYRVTDTRVPTNGTPIAPDTSETFDLAAAGSPVPAAATAVAANFTAVSGNAAGYATVYPTSDTTPPAASDLNWTANEAVPNFTIADTAGTGSVEVYASHGAPVNLVIDEFGYFVPSTPVAVPSAAGGVPRAGAGATSSVASAAPLRSSVGLARLAPSGGSRLAEGGVGTARSTVRSRWRVRQLLMTAVRRPSQAWWVS